MRRQGRLRLESDAALLACRRHARRRLAALWAGSGGERIEIAAERDGARLTGIACLPTLSRSHARHQFLFVNGRPVQDRLLKGALRAAYADLIQGDRQPVAALFLELPLDAVDVNVHPTKAEVRFREAGEVRGLIVGGLKRALAEHGHRTSSTVAHAALGRFTPGGLGPVQGRNGGAWTGGGGGVPTPMPAGGLAEAAIAWQAPGAAQSGGLSGGLDLGAPSVRRGAGGGCRRRPPATTRSVPPAPSCTIPISWRRRRTASSSSTSTRRMSGWSTSG
jgi:hypothetical protein